MLRLLRLHLLPCSIVLSFIISQPVYASRIANSIENPTDAIPFSFSISGGVSLGSYEAGINWALLHYLKIQRKKYETDKHGIYALYPELSSLSGASAGSINALFSAVSWCVDERIAIDYASKNTVSYQFKDNIDNNLFRDIWVNVGIDDLLPDPTGKEKYYSDDGLFTRHAFDDAIKNFKSTMNQAIFREDCQVPLGITVTRVKPGEMSVAGVKVKNQRFMIPLRIESDKNNKNKMVIVSHLVNENDAGMGNVMYLQGKKYTESTDKYAISADDVVASILTSSAFPIAFGRMKLDYCSKYPGTKTKVTGSKLCPNGYQKYTDVFLDGGVFDNVPLGIARALAEPKPTDYELKKRWLQSARRYNYVYIDPSNLRETSKDRIVDYSTKSHLHKKSSMTFGIKKQLEFLSGAINTGRNYELYNILRGGEWSRQAYTFSCNLYSAIHGTKKEACIKAKVPTKQCKNIYRLIDTKRNITNKDVSIKDLSACLLNNSIYLEREYTLKVKNSRFNDFNCDGKATNRSHGEKLVDARKCLLKRLGKLAGALNRQDIVYAVNEAIGDDLGDRRIVITSRYAPITGNMLAYFGAFLDKDFREYDYYAGVYDAVNVVASYQCKRNRSKRCLSDRIKMIYKDINIYKSAAANTVFKLLATQEHVSVTDDNQLWQWISDIKIQSVTDKDEAKVIKNLEVIFKSLNLTVEHRHKKEFTLFEEFVFFSKALIANNYNTDTADSSNFMKRVYRLKDEDSLNWFFPLTSRVAGRLIQLEDAELENSVQTDYMRQILGVGALAVHSYIKNGDDSFLLHSSAPSNSWEQYLPYELGVDARNGGVFVAWEPSLPLSKSFVLNFNVAPIVMDRFDDKIVLFSQASLFLSYKRDSLISSIGFGPTVSNTWDKRSDSKQTNLGASAYLGILQDKMRVTFGTRSFAKDDFFGDTLYINVSITDVPGFSYWLFH